MGKATQSKTNPALLIGLVAVLVVAGAVGAYMLMTGGQEEPEFVVAPPVAPSAQPREVTPTDEPDEGLDEEDVGYLEPEEEEEEAEEPTLTRRRASERRFAAALDEDEEEEDEDEPREPRAMDMEDDLAP